MRAAVADSFGDPRQADCVVRFYLANDTTNHNEVHDTKTDVTHECSPRARGAPAAAANGDVLTPHARRFLGAPLPAHRLIICGGSELLQAQLERWQDPGGRAHACLATNGGPGDNSQRPHGRLPPARSHSTNASDPQHYHHEQQQQQHEGWVQHAPQGCGSDGPGTVRLRLEAVEAGATTTTTRLARGIEDAAATDCRQQEQQSGELLVRAHVFVLPRPQAPPPSDLPSAARNRPSNHQHLSSATTARCSSCSATSATAPCRCQCHCPHPDSLPPHLRSAPELLVPLGSETELRPALASLRYMYTGRVDLSGLEVFEGLHMVHAMGFKQEAATTLTAGPAGCGEGSSSSPMRELLAVRHAGAYLHVVGCGAACDEAMRELLLAGRLVLSAAAAGAGDGVRGSSKCSGGCGGSGGGVGARCCGGSCGQHADALRCVRELYACRHVLPDAREDPEFAGRVLAAALCRVLHDFEDVRTAVLDEQVGHRHGAGGVGGLVGLPLGQQQHVPGQLWRPWLAAAPVQPPPPPAVAPGYGRGGAGAAAEAPEGREGGTEGEPSRGDLLAWLLGGDVLAILNSPGKLKEVLGLPYGAMEELLLSRHLGTDDEASVLVLVEKWAVANGASSSGNSSGNSSSSVSSVDGHSGRFAGRELTTGRGGLRQLVRLVNVNVSYMTDVVPRMESWAGSSGAAADLALLLGRYARATGEERKRLAELYGKRYDMTKAWFSTEVRQQCVPEEGLSFEWEVAAGQLEGLLQQPKAQTVFASALVDQGNSVSSVCSATFDGTARPSCQGCCLRCVAHTEQQQQPGSSSSSSSSSSAPVHAERVTVGGYEWRVGIQAKQGDRAAGVFLYCYLPYAVQQQTGPLDGAAQVAARLEVYGRPCSGGADRACTALQGKREVVYGMEYRGRDGFVGYGDGWGNRRALPLAAAGGTAGVGEAAAGGGGDEVSVVGLGRASGGVASCDAECLEAGPAAEDDAAGRCAWGQYLLPAPGGDRRLCGRLTFLRPT